jgi:hypothetical protein
MVMFNGDGVDAYEAIPGILDATAGTGRVSGEHTNALRLGSHDHLPHVVAGHRRVSAA